MRAQAVAGNGSGTVFVVTSDSGWVAQSSDLQTWTAGPVLDGNFTPLGVSWSPNGSGSRPVFAMAGSRVYNDDNTLPGEYMLNDQVAQILINESGSVLSWDQAFTHPYANSWFHNVRYFTDVLVNGISTAVWVAVGHVSGQPDIWYSENINWISGGQVPDTSSWIQVTVPSGLVNRPLYDVTASAGTLYFSGRGVIINTTDLGTPVWNVSAFFSGITTLINPTGSMLLGTSWNSSTNVLLGTNFTADPGPPASTAAVSNQWDLISLASNSEGQLVAVSSGNIVFSNDRVGWITTQIQGYYFRSVIWYRDHWIAGAYSDLTQWTYWTSTDGTTWLPWNNGLQIYGFWANENITLPNTGSDLTQ